MVAEAQTGARAKATPTANWCQLNGSSYLGCSTDETSQPNCQCTPCCYPATMHSNFPAHAGLCEISAKSIKGLFAGLLLVAVTDPNTLESPRLLLAAAASAASRTPPKLQKYGGRQTNKNRSGEPRANATRSRISPASHRRVAGSTAELGKPNAGAAEKRRHGSTALFVAVDYAFLLAFAGFLAYLVGSRILPSVAPSA
nr:unnamed protein product [Digitaria exilis]